jgi:hypothetical protein
LKKYRSSLGLKKTIEKMKTMHNNTLNIGDEVKVSLRIPGDEEILPEDVANLYVDLVG